MKPLTWRRLTHSRRWLRIEAWIYLLLSRLAIRLIPFRKLTWFFERPAARPGLAGAAREQLIRDVRWAIWSHARDQPERIVCFPRGITAQAMLRQRGVATTLYYGATSDSEKGLNAHVWVQDGELGIIGTRTNAGYKVLARYAAPSAEAAAALEHIPH